MLDIMTQVKAKPFLKWAGGKSQLLSTIDFFLPESFRKEKDVTYIEPFIGGGAMLFFMLQKYPNIKNAIINDINPHLINTYIIIRDSPHSLIDKLAELQEEFRSFANHEEQKDFYLNVRNRFNRRDYTNIEEAAIMIFLNRTCFNGLYRENSKGYFNVPFGRYTNPTICNDPLIMADSQLLQKVDILQGDFTNTGEYVDGYTFFYLDPPYRPLDSTSNFNSYVKEKFDDTDHKRLRDFYVLLSSEGCRAILSNSDCKGRNDDDNFFDELYKGFYIERVNAKRSINSIASRRDAITELLIRNYDHFQGLT